MRITAVVLHCGRGALLKLLMLLTFGLATLNLSRFRNFSRRPLILRCPQDPLSA
jgi:hypothetical protein